MKILNPATGEAIREIGEWDPPKIARQAEKSMEAGREWSARSWDERIGMLMRFRRSLADRREELARLLTQEMGKPISQARNEVNGTLGRLDYFAENARRALEPEVVLLDPAQGIEERIEWEPLGLIANISAWNYPYFVGLNVLAPALAVGDSILYKPSELATLTGLEITALWRASGVPEDVMACVVGGGEAGAALLQAPIAGVFFTGSHATGVRIAESASKRMIRVQLELGGKDPVYVCDDIEGPGGVGVEAVVAGVADGAFYNTGQSCCSVERIYVHERLYAKFVEAFVAEVRKYRVGDPLDETTYIGPLARAGQITVLEKQVADARAKGGKVLLGGKRIEKPGNWFEPTVVTDASASMELMREESFGPVIGIQKVSSDDEAVRVMNDTRYGLTAAVYTPSREKAAAILSKTRSGSAYWNCCDRVSPRLPWLGRGDSGIGCTLSTHGIRALAQMRAWHLKRA